MFSLNLNCNEKNNDSYFIISFNTNALWAVCAPMMTKSNEFNDKGQYQECLKLIDQVIEEQPDCAGAYFYPGEVYL